MTKILKQTFLGHPIELSCALEGRPFRMTDRKICPKRDKKRCSEIREGKKGIRKGTKMAKKGLKWSKNG